MTDMPDHHEQLRQAMDAVRPAIEAFSIVLDTFEGLVSTAKARGWDDHQARELVLKMLTTPGTQQ